MYLQLAGTNVRLLGSMHLFPATSRRTPPWVAQAYDWADALMFESDPPAILPLLRDDSPQGASQLQPCVRADTWQQLQALWPAEGPLAPFTALRPWAALLIAPTLFQQVVEGVEPRLMRSALAQSRPFDYLETADDIVAALESIPLAVLGAALDLLIADRDEPQRTLERMHAAWLQGDLDAVQQVAVASPMFNLPGMREAILDRRNRAWAARLAQQIGRPERTLVVVGALHLCGPGNLLECMAYPVEALLQP
jgi:uncharacterized protein